MTVFCKIIAFQQLSFLPFSVQFLGSISLKAYLKLIQSIESAPLQYPVIYKEVRMARFGRAFPLYSILFFLREDTAYIVSIFHDNRDWNIWQERVS